MRVLVIGSGGREHALCEAIARSPLLTRLWCAPGNPGTAQLAENVAIAATDIAALVAFAQAQAIELVVPGPEAPLVAGLTDAMLMAGIPCCGPTRAAAQLEASKTFTKELCDEAGIPTALWERFEDAEAARDFVTRRGAPIVIKADGLAGGKGVVVAQTEAEALAAVDRLIAAGPIVIEECLAGEEISLFVLCDGETGLLLGAAQDHKRAHDGDTGPNTGGMGAYSPAPALTVALQNAAIETIVMPTLAAMAARGTPFRGVLFAGLMLTESGPRLIEYNVRFGDPECQALLLRLQSDLLPALVAAHDGALDAFDLRWSADAAISVVLAAPGYPEAPRTGSVIRGLERAGAVTNVRVYHAGTALAADGTLVAAGGRVLTVCATGPTLREARDAAYRAVDLIQWPEGFCRRDIGWRALGQSPADHD
jgi:phosphoribosylamine--glycine ligase